MMAVAGELEFGAMAVARHSAAPGPDRRLPWAFVVAVGVFLGALVYLFAALAGTVPREVTGDGEAEGSRPFTGVSADRYGAGSELEPFRAPAIGPTTLEQRIAEVVDPAGRDEVGVAVLALDGTFLGGLNPDLIGYAASTFKLALLYEAERRVSLGLLSYGDRIVVTDEARSEDLGTLARVPVADDDTVTLGDALHAMVTFSDNATAVALLRLLGPAEVDQTLRALGIATFSVNDRDLPVSPRDLAALSAAIARGQDLAPEQRSHALGLLAKQEVRAGIPAALEALPGVELVANKTGTWPGLTRDVAFVQTDRGTYALAIMVPGDWNWPLVRSIAATVHEALTLP